MMYKVPAILVVFLVALAVLSCAPAPVQQVEQVPQRPVLVCSPTNLAFTARTGQVTTMEQVINIFNQGGGVLAWTASDNARWIDVKQLAGQNNLQGGAVKVTVDPSAMAPGDYTGIVSITSEGALGSPCHVPVFLNIPATAAVPAVQVSQPNVRPDDTSVVWKNDINFTQYATTSCCMVSGSITNIDKWWYLSKVTITGSKGSALIAETLPPGETVIYNRCIPCYQREEVKLVYTWYKP